MEGQSYDDWIGQGIIYVGEGKLTEAKQAFEKARETKPEGFEVYANLGALEQLEGEHQMAIDYFNTALKINPEHLNSWYNKGISLASLQEFSSALEAYDKALDIDPGYAKIYLGKGYALMRMGEKEQAASLLQSFLQLATDTDKELKDQASLWLKVLSAEEIQEDEYQLLQAARESMDAGDGGSALQFLNQFLDLHPTDHAVLIQRAYIYAQTGDWEASKVDSDLASKIDPQDAWVHYFQARIALVEEDKEKAKKLLDRALELDEGIGAEVHTVLAEMAEDPQERFQLLSKAITQYPNFPKPYLLRGKIFQERGKILDALSDFSSVLAMNPNHTEAYQWVEDIFAYLDDHVELHKDDASHHSLRAQAYLRLGRHEDALSDWVAALSIEPDNTLLIRGMTQSMVQTGQLVRAWEELGRAIVKHPEVPELRLDRAQISIALMKTEEAEEDLIEVINMDASISEAHFLKGQLFASQNKGLEAETHFQQALQLGMEHPELYRQLGLIALQKEDQEKSLEYLEKGIELGKNEEILLDAAYVSQALGKNDKSLTFLDTLLGHWSQNKEGWELKAQLELAEGNKEKAYQAFFNLTQLNPLPLEGWQQRMKLAYELEKWPDALGSASRVLGMIEGELEALKVRGMSYYHLGKRKSAKRDLEAYASQVEELSEEENAILEELEDISLDKKKKPWWKWK